MIRLLIKLTIFIIVIDTFVSYFPEVRRHYIFKQIKSFVDNLLHPIRRILPQDLPVDISPLIAILLLNLLIALW